MSKALVMQARNRILDDAAVLRKQPTDQLRVLAKTPKKEQLQIQQRPIEITAWAREHGQGTVAVIVEARRLRFLGWSQVTAEGFYKASDGTVTDFREKDYWDHGY